MALLSMGIWIFCERILNYEYRKGLSESVYAHKLFWWSNLLLNIAALVYGLLR